MIERYQVLNKEYSFALQNGYKGSHYDYVMFNYNYYVKTCKRNNIEPNSWFNWLQNQEVN